MADCSTAFIPNRTHSIVTRSSNASSDSSGERGLIPFLIDDNVWWAAEIHRFCLYDIKSSTSPFRVPKPAHRLWTVWYGSSKTISPVTRTRTEEPTPELQS